MKTIAIVGAGAGLGLSLHRSLRIGHLLTFGRLLKRTGAGSFAQPFDIAHRR
jgi:hypothetical protein